MKGRSTAVRLGLATLCLAALPATGQSSRSVWDGVYSAEQAKRGLLVYQLECQRCHGATLAGMETAGPLAGPLFTSNWNGVNMADMLDRVRMSMPQDRPGTISRQKIADVLAYVLSANRFPAGTVELSRQGEYLRLIQFEATRPTASRAGGAKTR